MRDIKIFKKCKKCNHWLTLMSSLRMFNDNSYLGTRCLNCGDKEFIEYWQIYYPEPIDLNYKEKGAEL